ncbi:MAG: SCO family protein [Burkholderiaceae bacterium]|nr:SCO family protein [Burkholderiaceae bacterium]
MFRSVLAGTMVLALGVVAAYRTTDGFTAFTYESARRLAATQSPRPLPADLALETEGGQRRALASWPEPLLVVDFVYTGCTTLCVSLGSLYAQLASALAPQIARHEVRLLTVSFDLDRDNAAALAAYRRRHAPFADGWDIARPADARELKRWLDAFGVVVVPDRFGGYVHNAAIAVVGPQRRLLALHDIDGVTAVVESVRASAAQYRGAAGVHSD